MLEKKTKKTKAVMEGAGNLSLGISMVVAVLIGIGLGILMKNMIGYDWLLWLGVAWGVGGAGLNVYKAYKKRGKSSGSVGRSRTSKAR